MLSLQAQSYLISFVGTGGSTSVASVKVENLTKGTNLALNGSDILRLDLTVGIEPVIDNIKDKIRFSPNPMIDFSKMQFDLPETGETIITLYDVSGKELVQTQDMLSKGQHFYSIQGVETGIYFVRISSGKYSLSGRLISSGSKNNPARIVYENTIALQEKHSESKGTNAEVAMQYTVGDRLKFTGTSGIYSTVITDIPTLSKTITFNFINCTDGDNFNYPVVGIGTQVWMAENLKTTTYRNGVSIGTTIPYNKEIAGEIAPAYQWAYAGNESNVATYGRLYTWFAVTDIRNVCPTGWRLPNDNDWTTLTNYLGGVNIAGGKLKEAGITHWTTPNAGATNETGFTALPGGLRSYNGAYTFVGSNGFWWSSSEYSSTNALDRDMDYRFIGFFWNYNLKSYGFSVRCLRD